MKKENQNASQWGRGRVGSIEKVKEMQGSEKLATFVR